MLQDQRGPQNAAAPDSPQDPAGGFFASAPPLSLPRGGGAIRGIDEKFAVNPLSGTASLTIPLVTSPGRAGFGPQLALSYDSGAGNGPFGFGWSLSLPGITRKTDKGLPRYLDAEESDVFVLSGAEDLVPVYRQDADGSWVTAHAGYRRNPGECWVRDQSGRLVIHEDIIDGYRVRRYRPRIEGLFARIERWTSAANPAETFWRSLSRDNVTTWYGRTPQSRIADPDTPGRIFNWLVAESHDDKGNAVAYRYEAENTTGVDVARAHERNRTAARRSANRYLRRVLYGNRRSLLDADGNPPRWLEDDRIEQIPWLFETVFDYGENLLAELPAGPSGDERLYRLNTPAAAPTWAVRPDPFSSYRAGFELRTYRLCHRVLLLHHFPAAAANPAAGVAATAGYDGLVRATEFTYAPPLDPDFTDTPVYSRIAAVTQSGFARQGDGHLRRSLPPLEFEYSRTEIGSTVRDVPAESLENLPAGLEGGAGQWVDLDGEGLPGFLTAQGGAWYYQRNLSALPEARPAGGEQPAAACFGPLETVSLLPGAPLSGSHIQFLDLAGNGQRDAVQLAGPVRGFFQRTADDAWAPFRAFAAWPTVNPSDPNLRFVDLDGDGRADLLLTEDNVFCWHASLAEEGFGPGQRVAQPFDEETGPHLVFADAAQSIYLADFSGDGLADLVRIRNGDICYWPDLGYGRFGAKVTMDHAPWFDAPDQFDQKRVRLGDVDGSGPADLLYLHRDGVRVYFNQSGNSWSQPQSLPAFPAVDHLAAVQVVDLLGNGTACLVWSSPLPGASGRRMCYVDLMGAKPHLLIRWTNNLGAETRIDYAPSTKFYLADRHAGRPWITRLPFPVHVVERTVLCDHVSRNRFVSSYSYHHGHYDGVAREFRGFGRVDQRDTAALGALSAADALPDPTNEDAAFNVPPVLTKTWYHTGAWLDGGRISRQFANEYDREGTDGPGDDGLSPAQRDAMSLPDTVPPTTVRQVGGNALPYSPTADELREACRALKGSMLRQEVYALDTAPDGAPSPASRRPYRVSENSYTIECLQPREDNRHAVHFCHPREALSFHYERALHAIAGVSRPDPRVTHTLNLAVDSFGNVLRSAAIAYGRRCDDPDPVLGEEDRQQQRSIHISFTESDFTRPVLEIDDQRLPLPAERRTYEIVKLSPASQLPGITNLFRFDELTAGLAAAGDGAHDLPYTDIAAAGASKDAPYRRLTQCVRTLYRKNNLTSLLPRGGLESHALPGESYKLAFTPDLLDRVFQRANPDGTIEKLIPDPAGVLGQAGDEGGGYVDLEGDNHWWAPSGRIFYSPVSDDSAAGERAVAQEHFFLPRRFRDPFHTAAHPTEKTLDYDAFDLLVQETRDALGNRITAGERDAAGGLPATSLDYRVLQPRLLMDANRNRTAAAFDALGFVVGTAVMGKPPPAAIEGDHLGSFLADLHPTQIDSFFRRPRTPHPTEKRGIASSITRELLGTATTRIVYALDRFRAEGAPAFSATLARETHATAAGGDQTEIQVTFSYSDGFGREIQKKIQAEPGPVAQRDDAGNVVVDAKGQPVMTPGDLTPRWVGSGWTIYNNKGKPVRQYEAFFDETHDFRFASVVGLSAVLFYDPLDRVVATQHPDGTYGKVVINPWRQTSWDVNDTVALDPRTDPDVAGVVAGYFAGRKHWKTWLQERQVDPQHPPADTRGRLPAQDAAVRALVHAATPRTAFFDTLGRSFVTVADNGPDANRVPQKFASRVRCDSENNPREIRDAAQRLVMRYDYNLLGHRIRQASMEAGERWTPTDVFGNSLYTWDRRGHRFRTRYDVLRRPVATLVREGTSAESTVVKIEYGEAQSAAETLNLRGKPWRTSDQAGVVTHTAYDFKGNLLSGCRQLALEYKAALDWSGEVALDPETFCSSTSYDALNRVVASVAPHSSSAAATTIRPSRNEANLLERIDANLRGNPTLAPFVTAIDYDAQGQRTRINFGNGARTDYDYDPRTLRLARLRTDRNQTSADENSGGLQDLAYFYDPAGNITHLRDGAQQTTFFDGKIAEPRADFCYDAIYRLIEATGREHLGQNGGLPNPPTAPDAFNHFHTHPADPRDGSAMGAYRENYFYDAVGNILALQHRGSDPACPGWTRHHTYAEPSLLDPGARNNRLSATVVGDGATESYAYDAHGNSTALPHLPRLSWDFHDQLQATAQQVVNGGEPETTWYVYDASGQRTRKITESAVTAADKAGGRQPVRRKERIYLAGYELYREYVPAGGGQTLERETLHIADDERRIALVETEIPLGDSGIVPAPSPALIRYQFGNHLGSASLELDHDAQIISYEEYTPFGSTSYQAVRAGLESNPKRYRYTGKERDEESGFYYHHVRYYAPWLGRWTACDPAGLVDGANLYAYARANPVRLSDPNGTDSSTEEQKKLNRWNAMRGSGAKLLSKDAPVPGARSTLTEMTDPSRRPYQSVMESKDTIRLAQLTTNLSLGFLGGEIAAPAFALLPGALQLFAGGVGALMTGWQAGEVIGGVSLKLHLSGPLTTVQDLHGWDRFEQGAYAGTGLLSLGFGAAQTRSETFYAARAEAFASAPPSASTLAASQSVTRDAPASVGAAVSATATESPGAINLYGGTGAAKSVSVGGTGRALAGHAATLPGEPILIIPPKTYVNVYAPEGYSIKDSFGRLIEKGLVKPLYTFGPGDKFPNYAITPPTGLNIMAESMSVAKPTLLSQILRENMGVVDLAVCRGADVK